MIKARNKPMLNLHIFFVYNNVWWLVFIFNFLFLSVHIAYYLWRTQIKIRSFSCNEAMSLFNKIKKVRITDLLLRIWVCLTTGIVFDLSIQEDPHRVWSNGLCTGITEPMCSWVRVCIKRSHCIDAAAWQVKSNLSGYN